MLEIIDHKVWPSRSFLCSNWWYFPQPSRAERSLQAPDSVIIATSGYLADAERVSAVPKACVLSKHFPPHQRPPLGRCRAAPPPRPVFRPYHLIPSDPNGRHSACLAVLISCDSPLRRAFTSSDGVQQVEVTSYWVQSMNIKIIKTEILSSYRNKRNSGVEF